MMQHHQSGRPVAGPSSNTSNNSGNTVINRSKVIKGPPTSSRNNNVVGAGESSTASTSVAGDHHHHHNNNNNNNLKGATASAPSISANEFKTKTVLKEAVDAVVSSFAKHSQGYGRGKLISIFKKS